MRTVTHREMRNDSGAILRAVAAGEDILVTNHGQPAAFITRPPASVLERLRISGSVRTATKPPSSLRSLEPRPASTSTRAILDDLRGDR